MNPNQALWEKGDFTRLAATMRDSGEALVDRIGITKGLQVLDLGCGDGTTAVPAARLGADVLGVDIARNLVEAGNRRAKEAGLTNLSSRRRRVRLADLDDEHVRSRREHLRRDVRPAAVRRGQGDGARHPARRPDRHGQLDSGRPDTGGPDPEDQLGVLAAAARRVRQPDDVGDRRTTSSSASPRPESPRRGSRCEPDTFVFERRCRRRSSSPCSGTTTARR